MQFTITNKIVSKTPSGNSKTIKVYEISNPNSKQHIYLQAGLHGTELTGTPILFELINLIQNNPEDFKDYSFTIVPICNPESTDSQIMGLQTGYNNIHTNAQNCENYNRPNLKKIGSIEYKHIQTLFELSQNADILIDLHTAGKESLWHVYCNKNLISKAKHFGVQNIIAWDSTIGCFEDLNFEKGKETYTLECGPSRSISQKDIEKGIKAILNFLKKQEQNLEFNILNENQIQSLKANDSGFLVWNIKVGEKFKKDQTIAQIINGVNQKTLIKAPKDGILFIKDNIHAVFENQQIAELIIN